MMRKSRERGKEHQSDQKRIPKSLPQKTTTTSDSQPPSLPCTSKPPNPSENPELPNGTSSKAEETDEINSSSNRNLDEDTIEFRLEKLRLAGEDPVPEITHDQLLINDQIQQDELLAMESIYGDNIFILDNQSGLRSFQVHVHIEAPEEFTISAILNSSSDLETKTDGSSNFTYSFNVKHLPPILLTCLLPKSYPSHHPPYFTISVQWLDSAKVSDLCSMMDSIWEEQLGQEVIYQWIEWLQTSSISYLGFDKEIVLGPYGRRHTGDIRAISGCVSPDVDIPALKNYNDEQNHVSFCENLHLCCICYSEFAGTNFIRLPCQHFYCMNCMKTYSDMHVKEGTVGKLTCPDEKCKCMVPPGLLKRLLGDEEFERWESLMLQKSLELMSDVAYCPRCETACIEDRDHHAQCSKCYFNFCTLCRERLHVGTACLTPELRLRILEDRQDSNQLRDQQKHREKEMINELLSVREALRDAKQCPSCKILISKTEGCNKMVCQNCEQKFCYRCSKAIAGYDHFRDGVCDLFPQEMIRNWEVQVNERQVMGRAVAQLFGNRGHPCPVCRQINGKVGNNNHIFCWACNNHYCFLCLKLVRRSTQHFGNGPNRCKQHTEG